jgi:GAF domain-containing protein
MSPVEPEVHLLEYLLSASTLLLAEQSLDKLMERLVELACLAIPGCDHAGITTMRLGSMMTSAATDGTTLRADGFQYEQGDGPCVVALRQGALQRIDDMASEQRFGSFPVEASRLGIRSTLAVPLRLGSETIGALNLYSA